MTQDGLLIGVTIGGEGNPSHTLIHTPTLTRVIGQCAEFTAQGWGARPFIFFSPVQTGLPRELAKLLTRATQPGLLQCLLAVATRLNGTIRRASHQSPEKIFAT